MVSAVINMIVIPVFSLCCALAVIVPVLGKCTFCFFLYLRVFLIQCTCIIIWDSV